MHKTREYSIWAQIRYRCSPKKRPQKSWRNYGGRGIRVCKEWDSFEAFFAHVGAAPSAAHTIDRINNDGHYEPGNVRWATVAEQRANTRATFWERVVMLLSERSGFSREWVRLQVAEGMSDDDLARHIARVYHPDML